MLQAGYSPDDKPRRNLQGNVVEYKDPNKKSLNESPTLCGNVKWYDFSGGQLSIVSQIQKPASNPNQGIYTKAVALKHDRAHDNLRGEPAEQLPASRCPPPESFRGED